MHLAALPHEVGEANSALEVLLGRPCKALMVVRDDKEHALEPPCLGVPQELIPGRKALGIAKLETQDLPKALFVHANGD